MVDLKKTYDAIVVGSGAAGGIAAKELTEGGLQVLLLEAGSSLDPARDFRTHRWPYEMPVWAKNSILLKTRVFGRPVSVARDNANGAM